jgi:hypothetical protein
MFPPSPPSRGCKCASYDIFSAATKLAWAICGGGYSDFGKRFITVNKFVAPKVTKSCTLFF